MQLRFASLAVRRRFTVRCGSAGFSGSVFRRLAVFCGSLRSGTGPLRQRWREA
jgi:hypothetical protein